MRVSIILLGLGAVTVGALIFVAQTQGKNPSRRGAPEGVVVRTATPANDPDHGESGTISSLEATIADSVVSNSSKLAQPEASPRPSFEGDAWTAGVRAYESGDYELAVEALEVAVQEQEDSAYRHYLLGLGYRRIGEAEGAVEEFTRSLSLAPNQPRAYAHLGRAFLDLEQPQAAREAIDQGLECTLEHADLWQVLGRVELDSGNYAEAEAAFGRAVELDPEHDWAWNNLGYVRLLQGKWDDAAVALRRATENDEAVPSEFLNNLGHVLEQLGDLEAASQAFARAAALGHESAVASESRIAALLEAQGELHGPPVLAESN